MNREKLEIYKQRYAKDWEKFKHLENAEKLFYEYAKAKEKLERTKEKVMAQTQKEKKREARALIILAKLLISHLGPEQVRHFVLSRRNEFIQKERGKEIDYSKYIFNLLDKKE